MVLLLVTSAGLLSCQLERGERPRADLSLPGQFSGSGTQAVGDQWWRAFGDGDLNTLESRALAGNFSLESAAQRLRQAEAVLRQTKSELGAKVDGELSGSVLDVSEGSIGGSYGLGLGASYEVDLWGRIRTRVSAEKLRTQASGEDYRAAAISLSAEVATTWMQLLEARAQQELLQEQIGTNEKVVQSLEGRFVEGQGRGVDILRQRQLVEATRERLTVAELQSEILEHQLQVLLGRAPGTGGLPTGGSLPSLPASLRTGLPVQLLERRPDVRAAFARIRAADAEVAAAMADRYPSLSLGASIGTSEGNSASDLFSNWTTQLSANLIGPIVDAGLRQAEVDRNEAVLREAIADYRQLVVEAIGEVENALARERKQLERIRQLERQLSLAERSSHQLQREFINGVTEYLDVLTALDDEQELRRTLLSARRELLEYRIALYRSLAGGFTLGKA
ncbi:membrane protein [Roseibacillus persicicus]|uniref:Membrane protein n=1 Tax=Roseibacillus persicicus TaxID=454148 RepID=A0A918TDU0_9BACT|nr:membrane protein [Roseibacillus persicicus]